MSREPDRIRVTKTIAFLLRHRPDVGGLTLDEAGFVAVTELAGAVSRLLRVEVAVGSVRGLVADGTLRRVEVIDDRVRALDRNAGQPTAVPPDICYHATTREAVDQYVAQGHLGGPNGRPVYLSQDESQAWRAAHRMGSEPRVLYVDTARCRRHGVRFTRNRRTGLFQTDTLPVLDVLNLRPAFAEQVSAGGIPLLEGPDGRQRMALIQVGRRTGVTWEVAKGKLEPGETPQDAAVREVREEMGLEVPLDVGPEVGTIRYGFVAPGGLPRLKTVFLYLLPVRGAPTVDFTPSTREGIAEVRWFTPEEAVRAVRHSSLIPLMRRARRMVEQP